MQIEFPEGRLELSVHNSLRNLQSPRTLITPHSIRLDLVKVALEAISFDKATLLLNQIYRRPSDKQFAKSTLEDTVHRMGLELYHKLIAQKDAFLAQHVLNACQAEDYAAIAEHVLSAEGSALTTATTAASATPEADSAGGHQDQTVTLTLFTDGECKLQDTGASMLDSASFYQFLDWYHIQHNVITLLKQALKGDREDSNKKEFIRSVLDNLWYGNTDLALIRLKQVDKACIKNSQALERIITYIINKSRYMTHYAARAFLGLPVSSCLGEMTNNVLVSSRQKLDNSASWTKHGSLALATLEALDRNGFLEALLANEPVNLLTNHAMTELPTAA